MDQTGGHGVAGISPATSFGGERSSGVDGNDDKARGRTSGLHLHDLRELTNPTEARTGPNGHRSLVDDELVRRRAVGGERRGGYGMLERKRRGGG